MRQRWSCEATVSGRRELAAETRGLDLGFDYVIHRSSDAKLLVVSSARKIATLQPGSDDEAWALRRAANA